MGNSFKSLRGTIGLASIAVALACSAASALAAESATATLSSTQLSPTSWQYSLTLNDTGTTDIGTFWFAWVPGKDFMPTAPTSVEDPVSWTAMTTHGGASDGFAIQWVAGAGGALAPGESLGGFTFDSSASPEQMASDSPFFPGAPVTTSFVYSGAPFSDAGFEFTAQAAAAVPEPSSFLLMGAAGLLLGVRTLRRRSSKAA